jgi:hypothetical protein
MGKSLVHRLKDVIPRSVCLTNSRHIHSHPPTPAHTQMPIQTHTDAHTDIHRCSCAQTDRRTFSARGRHCGTVGLSEWRGGGAGSCLRSRFRRPKGPTGSSPAKSACRRSSPMHLYDPRMCDYTLVCRSMCVRACVCVCMCVCMSLWMLVPLCLAMRMPLCMCACANGVWTHLPASRPCART